MSLININDYKPIHVSIRTLVSGHFLIHENIIMLTLFTSIKSLSLGIKLLELAYKLTLFVIGNDNCGEIVN